MESKPVVAKTKKRKKKVPGQVRPKASKNKKLKKKSTARPTTKIQPSILPKNEKKKRGKMVTGDESRKNGHRQKQTLFCL